MTAKRCFAALSMTAEGFFASLRMTTEMLRFAQHDNSRDAEHSEESAVRWSSLYHTKW
jgi:hypothetical protein